MRAIVFVSLIFSLTAHAQYCVWMDCETVALQKCRLGLGQISGLEMGQIALESRVLFHECAPKKEQLNLLKKDKFKQLEKEYGWNMPVDFWGEQSTQNTKTPG